MDSELTTEKKTASKLCLCEGLNLGLSDPVSFIYYFEMTPYILNIFTDIAVYHEITEWMCVHVCAVKILLTPLLVDRGCSLSSKWGRWLQDIICSAKRDEKWYEEISFPQEIKVCTQWHMLDYTFQSTL